MINRHPVAAGIAMGLVVGVLGLAFGTHFADARNGPALAITGGALAAFWLGMDALCRVQRKRATGTYSYSPVRTERALQARRNRGSW